MLVTAAAAEEEEINHISRKTSSTKYRTPFFHGLFLLWVCKVDVYTCRYTNEPFATGANLAATVGCAIDTTTRTQSA